MQSEAIGQLAKALSMAQAEIKPPTKGRTAQIKSEKGAYSYKYADLADVIECYRAPLSKNGLAVVQTMRPDGGIIILTTTLLHTSGEWIASDYPIPSYQRPQEQGSAITYARRYSATSLLGIAAEDDDDGAAAQHGTPKEQERQEQNFEAPPSSDAGIILDLAAALSEVNGQTPASIIKAFSSFTGKDGKEVSFTDPARQRSVKWLKLTRGNLEREMQRAGAMAAVGQEEVPF